MPWLNFLAEDTALISKPPSDPGEMSVWAIGVAIVVLILVVADSRIESRRREAEANRRESAFEDRLKEIVAVFKEALAAERDGHERAVAEIRSDHAQQVADLRADLREIKNDTTSLVALKHS